MNKTPVKGRINTRHARRDEEQGAPSPTGPKRLRVHKIAATSESQQGVASPKILDLLRKVGFEGVAPDEVSRNKSIGYAPHNSMVFLLVCEKGFESNSQCKLIRIANGGPEEEIGHGRVLAKSGCVDPQYRPGSIDIRLRGEKTIMDLIVHPNLDALPTPPQNGSVRTLQQAEPVVRRIPPLSPATKPAATLPVPAPAPIPVHTPKPDPIVIAPAATPPPAVMVKQVVVVATPPPTNNVRVPNGQQNENGIWVERVKLDETILFEGQPRQEFDSKDIAALSDGLKEEGQKQLITVTPIEGIPGKRWKVINGERRWRAAMAAGLKELDAQVKVYANEAEMFWDSFTMNWGSQGHTVMETSRAVSMARKAGKSIRQICIATHKSKGWVDAHLQLQKLAPELQELMRISVPAVDRLRLGVARYLSKVPKHDDQIRIWNQSKGQRTQSLITLTVERHSRPIIEALPPGDDRRTLRKQKPSDRADRARRVLRTMETDAAFLNGMSEGDIATLIHKNEGVAEGDRIRQQIRDHIESLQQLEKKINALRSANHVTEG